MEEPPGFEPGIAALQAVGDGSTHNKKGKTLKRILNKYTI